MLSRIEPEVKIYNLKAWDILKGMSLRLLFQLGYKGQTGHNCVLGARWLSGRASDSGARGLGFETYPCNVVSLSKTLYSPKVLVILRKRWLRPYMTEKIVYWDVKP